MRVLILGINYAPERTGIAPYTTGLARHLSVKHDVTVLTGLPHYPDWVVDDDYRNWRAEELDGKVRVIRLRHYVPTSPTAYKRAIYEMSWAARAAATGLALPCDLVIAVVPALFGAHAARLIARRHGAAIGLYVQDVVSQAAATSGYGRAGRLVTKVTAALEKKALIAADGITTIHPALASELMRVADIDKPPNVIFNWTHIRPAQCDPAAMRAELGWLPDDFVALHTGNMGAKQNLEVLIEAARIATAEGSSVRFALAGGGHQRTKLESAAADCAKIQFLDTVDDKKYSDVLAAADVLLVNERPGMADVCVPSKLTSYLAAGRPIIAATERTSATASLLRLSGAGVVCDPGAPQMLLRSIEALAADRTRSETFARAGINFANERLRSESAGEAQERWVATLVPSPTTP